VLQDWQELPGALKAVQASTHILELYKDPSRTSKDLADYLRDNVYPFSNEQVKDLPAGGSDPKYQKRIAENTSVPEMQVEEPIKNDWPQAGDTPLKGTLTEYLRQLHGAENTERISISMQVSMSEALRNANQNVEL